MEPALRTPIDPRSDLPALRALATLLRQRPFDVAHTHTSKAGVLGRMAAHRAAVPRIVHTYHGFPFHEFQSRGRRGAYVAIERRLGRITDVALCVGTGVAVEAVRRRLVAPERIRTIGVAVEGAAGTELPARMPGARDRARRALGVPAGATVVGAVGRLAFQKAPEDFLTMIDHLGRAGVVGVWVGGGELAGHVRRLAETKTAGCIVLAGERHDVPEILPAFHVFVLPSLLRRTAHGGRRGYGGRYPRGGDRGQRRRRRGGARRDGTAGAAAASGPGGRCRAVSPRPARRGRGDGRDGPGPAG